MTLSSIKSPTKVSWRLMVNMTSNKKIQVQSKSIKLFPNFLLHKSLKVVILFGNCLGLLPVNGIFSDSVENLTFEWTSLKTLYTFIWILIIITILLTDFYMFIQSGLKIDKLLS